MCLSDCYTEGMGLYDRDYMKRRPRRSGVLTSNRPGAPTPVAVWITRLVCLAAGLGVGVLLYQFVT